jgi:molecular chaperone Hsp33
MSADSVIPFSFESLSVRGSLIHLSRAWRRMQRDHDYSPVLTETLGQAAAATGLIAHSLKFEGAITLQIQGGSALDMLVMQCTGDLDLRGMAVANSDVVAKTFGELTENAHCAVTVDAGDRPYQGIVAIEGESLAASLEHYFAHSVQVPSHLALVADAQFAGGLLLQQMPGAPVVTDDWQRLMFLARTLAMSDFQGDGGLPLIAKLFAEDDVRVYGRRPIRFHCRCSNQKVEDVLKMLGEEEIRAALTEQNVLEVICEYCGQKREFDAVDVERLFADNVVEATNSVQ